MESPKQFLLAGNATFTVSNKLTGNRFTFKVRKKKGEEIGPHFVSVLTGSNNEEDYTFFGTIFNQNDFKRSLKSRISDDSVSVKAFSWLWSKLSKEETLPEQISICHEGKCGRCGRTLTVPESVESGFGPECVKYV